MSNADICVVIPMKHPVQSKMRLNRALSDEQRAALAIHLFRNTLEFFRREFPQLTLLVVTPSAWVAATARQFGCEILLETSPAGLNQALVRATRWSLRNRFSRQLIIPADIEQLKRDEVLRLLAEPAQVVIANARDGGTNALLCTPPDAIPFCYGEQSGREHARAAARLQLSCARLTLNYLSADIDHPQDLPPDLYYAPVADKVLPYA